MIDFILLFFTHILVLCLGYYAGTRVQNPYQDLPKTKSKTQDSELDIYDTERLDFT